VSEQILDNRERCYPLADIGRRLDDSVAASLPGKYQSYRYYARMGVRSRARRRVFLETVKLPVGECTSIEAVERFVRDLNDEEI